MYQKQKEEQVHTSQAQEEQQLHDVEEEKNTETTDHTEGGAMKEQTGDKAEHTTEETKEEVAEESIEETAEDPQEKEQKEETPDLPPAEQLHAELQKAKQQADEHYQRYLRAQADFDNFRRRVQKEKADQAKYAAAPLIESLLPVLDNFERALAAGQEANESASLIKGVEMVFKQLNEVLEEQGVQVIPSVGEEFDPHIHQAVAQVENDEYESGIVTEEVQKGYKLHDRVIRPAMVQVNQ